MSTMIQMESSMTLRVIMVTVFATLMVRSKWARMAWTDASSKFAWTNLVATSLMSTMMSIQLGITGTWPASDVLVEVLVTRALPITMAISILTSISILQSEILMTGSYYPSAPPAALLIFSNTGMKRVEPRITTFH